MSEASESGQEPLTSVKASLREIERRRSERLLLSVPIRVEGLDRNGERFSEDTRTIVINRQGARIFLKRGVTVGSTLHISTLMGSRSAKFRVVGPTQPLTKEGGEWGLECAEPNPHIWGIGFPSPPGEEGGCTALIECRRCHGAKLTHLSLVEHEVLGASGILNKECETCGRSTSWSYCDTSMRAHAEEVDLPVSDSAAGAGQREWVHRRSHNRVALQLPIRLRSYFGVEEFIRTENVSRGGLCFITDKSYEIGEVLLVTCPYERGGDNIEVRAQVVRRRDMIGTTRRIYGVSYER